MITKPNNFPTVSIIISTYNRPEMLRNCIKGVLNQSLKDWVIYVIGDCCSESTNEVIEEINDERIYYYNYSFRFGEQSGGNSLGIALAKTDYIAFLNHDDIWTPDHLEVAINSLKNSGTNFYVGRSIFSGESKNSIPVLKDINNNYRIPSWTFSAHFLHFEPCSTWVINASFAKKIGYWMQSIDLHRRPIQEYIMRTWRKGAKFDFGEQVTCISLSQHNAMVKDVYSYVGTECDYLFKLFGDHEKFKRMISDENLTPTKYTKNYRLGSSKFKRIGYKIAHDIFVNKFTAYLYYFTGLDGYHILNNLLFLKKGEAARKTLERRTGEKAFTKYKMNEVIDTIKLSIIQLNEYNKLDK